VSYDDLITAAINLSTFVIYKNGPRIINTRSDIILIFYIFVKQFLKTIIINSNENLLV